MYKNTSKTIIQSQFKSLLFGIHVSLRFPGGKFLINLGRQFYVRTTFSCM